MIASRDPVNAAAGAKGRVASFLNERCLPRVEKRFYWAENPSPGSHRGDRGLVCLFLLFVSFFFFFFLGRDSFQDDSQQTHNQPVVHAENITVSVAVSIGVGPKSFSLYVSRSLRSRSLALSRISLRSFTMVASLVEL